MNNLRFKILKFFISPESEVWGQFEVTYKRPVSVCVHRLYIQVKHFHFATWSINTHDSTQINHKFKDTL